MNYNGELVVKNDTIHIDNYLPKIGIEIVRQEIINGLQQNPRHISPKFFYDAKGSMLFEEITRLNEYYPTRTEKSILSSIVNQLSLDFSSFNIIELGSGDHTKISLLLEQIKPSDIENICYYPVDISQTAIENSANKLNVEFPQLQIKGIVADFLHHLSYLPRNKPKLICFFGSTLGNLDIVERKQFLNMLGKELLPGDNLLLGLDMVKDIKVLENAYNDNRQITAAFNKNILNVINGLVHADFKLNSFEHKAFYSKTLNRIEMHLVALEDTLINIPYLTDGILIRKGESIHTENSHKFTPQSINSIALWSGLSVQNVFTDQQNWFNLVHYKKA